ncbi:MAG: hypothetical protein J6S52_00945, partial [Prevotella sp.]|nr:hypothetical protein [Prevotella sp.]
RPSPRGGREITGGRGKREELEEVEPFFVAGEDAHVPVLRRAVSNLLSLPQGRVGVGLFPLGEGWGEV